VQAIVRWSPFPQARKPTALSGTPRTSVPQCSRGCASFPPWVLRMQSPHVQDSPNVRSLTRPIRS